MHKDQEARDAVEETASGRMTGKTPPAGPHAEKELTDGMKTPGTGLLPDRSDDEVNAPSG